MCKTMRPTAALHLLLLCGFLAAATTTAAAATDAKLRAFASCDDLLSFYHDNAIKRVSEFARESFVQSTPSPDFFPDEPSAEPESPDEPSAEPASPDGADEEVPLPEATTAATGEGSEFSGTNVQVQGVDEPDIVKTDGSRIFVVRGRVLFLVRAGAARANGTVVAQLALPTGVREMLIENDTLVLLADDFDLINGGDGASDVEPIPSPEPLLESTPGPALGQASSRSPSPDGDGPQLVPITVVYRVSAAGGALKLRNTLRMQGNYLSAREVGGVIRVVTSFRPTFTFEFPRLIERGEKAPSEIAAEIRKTGLETWVPQYTLSTTCGPYFKGPCPDVRTGQLVSCPKVYAPVGEFSAFSLLVVTTIQTNGPFHPQGNTAVTSEGQNVYSTASILYVATSRYEADFAFGSAGAITTSLHKFQLYPFASTYVGSVSVPGRVLNQFSMHEYRGVGYIATTVGDRFSTGTGNTSKSRITAFRLINGTLRAVGSVGNLGVGESIFAVRYVRTLAYVVTFRDIDPLYIVDIARPWRMRVTGELKIPGFSSYLHPIGDGQLLGVGSDVTLDGRTTGSKVSLFDVSNVTNPRELSVWTVKGSSTGAQWDHRAFLYWAPESVAVLPVQLFTNAFDLGFSGSIVLKIEGGKIVPKGRISHPKCCKGFSLDLQPSIERNFVLGKINLWSLSEKVLQVNDIRSLTFKSIVKLEAS